MAGMAKLYEREIDAPLLDAYWLALRDWTLEEFESAAGHLMRESKFMPRPAEFTALRKAARMTAGEAWALVLNYVRHGYVRWQGGGVTQMGAVTKPESEIIDRAVNAIGGYEAVAMSETDKTHFLERRFCEHYESIQDAEDIRECLPQLTGPSTLAISGPRAARDLLPKPQKQ